MVEKKSPARLVSWQEGKSKIRGERKRKWNWRETGSLASLEAAAPLCCYGIGAALL